MRNGGVRAISTRPAPFRPRVRNGIFLGFDYVAKPKSTRSDVAKSTPSDVAMSKSPDVAKSKLSGWVRNVALVWVRPRPNLRRRRTPLTADIYSKTEVVIARALSLESGERPRRPAFTVGRNSALPVEPPRTQPLSGLPTSGNLIYSKAAEEDQRAPATSKMLSNNTNVLCSNCHTCLRWKNAYAETASAITCSISNTSRYTQTSNPPHLRTDFRRQRCNAGRPPPLGYNI